MGFTECAATSTRPVLSEAALQRAWGNIEDALTTGARARFAGDATWKAHTRQPPPKCMTAANFKSGCSEKPATSCSCAQAAGFHAAAGASDASLSLPSGLRFLFFDGHCGPMNDMAALLIDDFGVDADRQLASLIFGQAYEFRNHLDRRLRSLPPLFDPTRLARGAARGSTSAREATEAQRALVNFMTRKKGGAMKGWGGGASAPECERYGVCMQALFDEAPRREFAARWGRAIARQARRRARAAFLISVRCPVERLPHVCIASC
jgi:hypothetical protein